MPTQLDRFIRLPGEATRFIPLEDVIALFLDLWFPNFEVLQKATFRVIRDSEMEIDEEAEDLVRTFESALKRRRRGTVIRLTFNADAPSELRDFVIAETDASPEDVMPNPGLLGLVDTKELILDVPRPREPRRPPLDINIADQFLSQDDHYSKNSIFH